MSELFDTHIHPLFSQSSETKKINECARSVMRQFVLDAREENQPNFNSSVSVNIYFERRILAISCGFIRFIAPTMSFGIST